MIDVSTRYLGLNLNGPIVVSSTPLSETLENVRRMEDAGAVLGSWLGIMSEWQRDWTRYPDQHDGLMDLIQAHAGSFARAVSFEFGLTVSAAG